MREYHIYMQRTKRTEWHCDYSIYKWLPWEYVGYVEGTKELYTCFKLNERRCNMKTYNRREVERIILKNGWELDHCTGGHSIYKKEGVKKTLSIAYKKCNRMVVQRLIKEFGLVT